MKIDGENPLLKYVGTVMMLAALFLVATARCDHDLDKLLKRPPEHSRILDCFCKAIGKGPQ